MNSFFDSLLKLADARDKKVITEQEFFELKSKLIARIALHETSTGDPAATPQKCFENRSLMVDETSAGHVHSRKWEVSKRPHQLLLADRPKFFVWSAAAGLLFCILLGLPYIAIPGETPLDASIRASLNLKGQSAPTALAGVLPRLTEETLVSSPMETKVEPPVISESNSVEPCPPIKYTSPVETPQAMIDKWISAMTDGDIHELSSLYGTEVRYNENGVLKNDELVERLSRDLDRWSSREFHQQGPVKITSGKDSRIIIAEVKIRHLFTGEHGSSSGTSLRKFAFVKSSRGLLIVGEKDREKI